MMSLQAQDKKDFRIIANTLSIVFARAVFVAVMHASNNKKPPAILYMFKIAFKFSTVRRVSLVPAEDG